MIELLSTLPAWQPASRGERCAVATVVAASGSVPRPIGTSMLVAPPVADGAAPRVLGSLSGGCVEASVVAAALDVIDDGAARLERFGFSPDDPFAVGLTCGGELEVHLEPLATEAARALVAGTRAPFAVVRRLAAEGETAVHDGAARLVLLTAPPAGLAELDRTELARALAGLFPGAGETARRAAALVGPVLAQGSTAVVLVEPAGGCVPGARPVRLLVESRLPAPRFVVVGANDFGAALIPAAKLLGYRVTLVDARPAFAGQERFAAADEVAVAWPHEYLAAEAAAGRLDARSVVCVLSHDPKFDVPLLDAALRLDLAYVGAMGSRRSHEQRIASLLEAGHGPLDLARLHSPIGLDLGAVTPAEVAVSILAEVVASRAPGAATGAPLRDRPGRIHSVQGSPSAGEDPRDVTLGRSHPRDVTLGWERKDLERERKGEPSWT
ncbi:XdhC family protein [Sinomonas sp. ASV322]|uniref:XdhC family protein n=1 Tax=Sinomonas sp. ASV322 TaxID=3041920 RepID=UPI0027DC7DD3|nr:XdhC family protein [Sinomonas sp. ASV322]MDQ4502427.1 XdhC family protein [Sinomonas sp. ASV322]